MARKRPTDDELTAMIHEGHFGQSSELAPADPIVPTPMVLEIDRITPFERNPRRERNPRYEEIRESIAARGGLDSPLTITRRPGEELFMVEAGGNTRLAILKELWQETGGEQFHSTHCLFRPWVSEVHVLTAHLVENEKRGDLIFIDKARAVYDLKQLLEAESGESMTQEALATALRGRGYRLERSLLSRMEYALETLLPRIPEALQSGMGQPQLQRIRQLEKAARRIWLDRRLGDAVQFGEVFGALLSRHDGPEWLFDRLRRAVENEIAEQAEEDVRRISMELSALISGREPMQLNPPEGQNSEPGSTAVHVYDGSTTTSTPSASAPTVMSDEEATLRDDGVSAEERELDEDSPSTSLSPEQTHSQDLKRGNAKAPEEIDPTGPTDLKSLRARAWVLAARIAQRHHMGEIVTPLHGRGGGFLVDFLYSSQDEEAETKFARATLWWFLVTVSEQFYAPLETVLALLPEGWREKPIARAIVAPDLDGQTEILAEYTLLNFGHLMGPLLIARLEERDWSDLLNLLDTYRRLKDLAKESGADLWEAPP